MTRAPAGGVGSNQYATKPGGGKPSRSRRDASAVVAQVEAEVVAYTFDPDADRLDPKHARTHAAKARVAASPDPDDRKAVAERLSTPPEILDYLADDRALQVQRAVAGNPKTPPDTLRRLAGDESFVGAALAATLAGNPSTPPDVLHRLAVSNNHNQMIALAENPNTSPETLRLLDREGQRTFVCRNLNCPPDILEEAARAGGWNAVQAARNPGLSGDTLAWIIDSYSPSEEIVLSAAENPSCPPDKIAWAYQLSDDPGRPLRIHAADNPSMQPPVLWDAAKRLPHRGCGLTAASRPDCPPEVLDPIVQYGSLDAKVAAARHPHASPEQLAKLAGMKDAKIIAAALDNPHISPAVIVRVALNDQRAAVSGRARKAIAHRGIDPVYWGDTDRRLSIEP